MMQLPKGYVIIPEALLLKIMNRDSPRGPARYLIVIILLSLAGGGCSRCSSDKSKAPASNVEEKHLFGNSVTDINGNSYQVKSIGGQDWFTENLRVTRFSNGDPIPEIQDKQTWKKTRTAGLCNFDNDPSSAIRLGTLYNWHAVADPRNLCPKGWHIPSEQEWSQLTRFLGGDAVAGGKMKNPGNDRWAWPNSGATNESGFNAIPNGYRSNAGIFYLLDTYTFFWTSTGYSGEEALSKFLQNDYDGVTTIENDHNFGFSVRCVKDRD